MCFKDKCGLFKNKKNKKRCSANSPSFFAPLYSHGIVRVRARARVLVPAVQFAPRAALSDQSACLAVDYIISTGRSNSAFSISIVFVIVYVNSYEIYL